ncbi:MAG: hypothetical protein MUE69_01985 [Myxococcota bacterium]|jgi:hypothetical protein|nr:hypothetical protein [Myxococcota bacterium]
MTAYALERLYADQDHDWVIDTIPAVLAWVPGTSKKLRTPPYRFPVERSVGGTVTTGVLELSWDVPALLVHDPQVLDKAQRYATKRTLLAEKVTELAALGLSLVAISAWMPGRRVVACNVGVAPDLVLDVKPGAVRGVECAGRASGGRNKLAEVANDKRPALLANPELAEVTLSLWSKSARFTLFEQVKP